MNHSTVDKMLSNADIWGEVHEEDKATYDQDFNISVLPNLRQSSHLLRSSLQLRQILGPLWACTGS